MPAQNYFDSRQQHKKSCNTDPAQAQHNKRPPKYFDKPVSTLQRLLWSPLLPIPSGLWSSAGTGNSQSNNLSHKKLMIGCEMNRKGHRAVTTCTILTILTLTVEMSEITQHRQYFLSGKVLSRFKHLIKCLCCPEAESITNWEAVSG